MKCSILNFKIVRFILVVPIFLAGITGIPGLVSQTLDATVTETVSYDAYSITRWILVGLAAVLLVILLAMANSVLAVARFKAQNFTTNLETMHKAWPNRSAF